MTAVGSAPVEDPSGVQAGIDRYRDLAKYVVTIFAAVAAAMLAGTQLSSVGSLAWGDDKTRIVVATVGFLVAFLGIFKVISSALTVLRPVEMSLEEIQADAHLKAFVEKRKLVLLRGLSSVAMLTNLLESDLLNADQRRAWADVATRLVDRVAFEKTRQKFESAWTRMVVWGVVGAIGIVAFSWAANPPSAPKSESGAESVFVTES